ncbi:hypothetical protein N9X25_10005, partial [Verrucomicrobiales bacterium]|nr:hypothetical protein [Verrucomicrobiales bacterium]
KRSKPFVSGEGKPVAGRSARGLCEAGLCAQGKWTPIPEVTDLGFWVKHPGGAWRGDARCAG